MGLRSRIALVTACAVAVLVAGRAEARQAPVLSPATVSGANITFNWSPTGGATSYRLDAGLAPGAYIASLPLGDVTTFSVTAPAVATYFARVVAQTPGGDVTSNEIAVVVTSLVAPPTTPTGLAVARNGLSIVVSWDAVAGAAGYVLTVDAPLHGSVAVPTATNSFSYGPVPAGDYVFRVAAANAGGTSANSANVLMNMPSAGACDAPPAPTVSTSVFGGFVTLNWTPVAGASAYLLSGYQDTVHIGSATLGGGTTRFSIVLPLATWRIDVSAVFSCGAQGTPGSANFVIDENSLKMQPREPDPAPGTALPGPSYGPSVVRDMAARYPGDLRNSCVEHGGNNRWLFRVVNALRERDKRWGLNWKRAQVGDMSQDVITYNFSADPDEGTSKLRAWDIIGGHCGSNPDWSWNEITSPAPPAFGNGARWTLLPYIQAGWTP